MAEDAPSPRQTRPLQKGMRKKMGEREQKSEAEFVGSSSSGNRSKKLWLVLYTNIASGLPCIHPWQTPQHRF